MLRGRPELHTAALENLGLQKGTALPGPSRGIAPRPSENKHRLSYVVWGGTDANAWEMHDHSELTFLKLDVFM